MNIAGVATAFPKNYFSQAQIHAAFKAYWQDKLENTRVLDALHAHTGVEGRHLVLPLHAYLAVDTFGKSNDLWIEAAQDLGQQAIGGALERAGLKPTDPGAIIFVSVTGIASPSIDARLVNRMGLSRTIRRMPIFGLGCVAGAAGLSRAADYVRAYPDQAAILLSVEICSLTLQRDDLSIANLISSGLFGDGAAAAIVTGDACAAKGPEIVATRSVFYPNTEDVMGWNISEKGFRIVLSPEVPEMARKHLRHDVDEFLAGHGLSRKDIGSWVLHTGGPKVLEAAQDALELHDGELQASWDSLKAIGNLSSSSVLHVLEQVIEHRRPAPGTWGVLAAMGPAFCSEVLLLKW
jgi:alkylresorcinol/alkylpyrone synthase